MSSPYDAFYKRHLQQADDVWMHQNGSNTTVMNDTSSSGSNNEDSTIIRETLRLYGAIYGISFLSFCWLRKRFPRQFSIRSWVPELACDEAVKQNEHPKWFEWIRQVIMFSDDNMLEQCGLDALCFCRALRFGRKLAWMGCLQALWLIPLYRTASHVDEDGEEVDFFALISIANVPSTSRRFVGTVVAAYIIFVFTMYLILGEYRWYTSMRHEFLSKPAPHNFTIYVSGIPAQYRSSVHLHQYFEKCSADVLQAVVTQDMPSLDAKVTKRKVLIQRLEHTDALQCKQQRESAIRANNYKKRVGLPQLKLRSIKRAARNWKDELEKLNEEIAASIGQLRSVNDPKRCQFMRSIECRNLAMPPSSSSSENSAVPASVSDQDGKDLTSGNFNDNATQLSNNDPDDNVVDGTSSNGLMESSSDPELQSEREEQRQDTAVMKTSSCSGSLHIFNNDSEHSTSSRLSGRRIHAGASAVVQGVGMGTKRLSQGLETGTKVMVQGIGVAGNKLVHGSAAATQTIAKHSRIAGDTIRKVAKDTRVDKMFQSAGEQGVKGIKVAVTSVGTVLPMLLNKDEGAPREGGFVVFTNLYDKQTAQQVIHHQEPHIMEVHEAPNPKDIFWRNVGSPARARRTGRLAAIAASAVLCFFYTIPISFISSLTEVNSLKETLPRLGEWLEDHKAMEPVFAQIAPLLLLLINEVVLPEILRYFAQWEGHVSSAMLEASLFVKLGCFMIIQTFFVSAISGGIMAEISNILDDPGSLIDLLANSLPAQSTYFVQIILVSTCLLQAMELLRIYPLSIAFLRLFFGPNLTSKERRSRWGLLRPLEDPPEFYHAETFGQLILFYMVFFVYSTIAPFTSIFLACCFWALEIGYRYQFIHNYPRAFETGGKLWKYFIQFTLVSMLVAQLTLVGLLALKQSVYAGPALGPLIALTVLFSFYVNSELAHVSEYLPSYRCVKVDEERADEGFSVESLCRDAYLQPSLKDPYLEPEYEVDINFFRKDTAFEAAGMSEDSDNTPV